MSTGGTAPAEQLGSFDRIERVHAAALATRRLVRAVAGALAMLAAIVIAWWSIASGSIGSLQTPALVLVVLLIGLPPLDLACSSILRRRTVSRARLVRAARLGANREAGRPASGHSERSSERSRRRQFRSPVTKQHEVDLFEDPSARTTGQPGFVPLPDDLLVPDLAEVPQPR
ncbi:MAG: hypothetical protein AAF108_01690 [Planctomycetota bacterium]